jgi:hypothetical protein
MEIIWNLYLLLIQEIIDIIHLNNTLNKLIETIHIMIYIRNKFQYTFEIINLKLTQINIIIYVCIKKRIFDFLE